jgi:hypothetical protein
MVFVRTKREVLTAPEDGRLSDLERPTMPRQSSGTSDGSRFTSSRVERGGRSASGRFSAGASVEEGSDGSSPKMKRKSRISRKR